MSTDDPYCTPNPSLYSGRVSTPSISAGGLLLAFMITLIALPLIAYILFFMLFLSSIGSQNTDGPAPDANFAIRRQWGEEKLQHHFRAADQWIRKSTQIAKDVGSIKGVAPVGSPNSFGASFGESWAAMNLQVVGDNGEGVLYLPDFCADDPRTTYGFDTASWIFEDRRHPVLPSGKSWLEEHGVDSLYDQVFEFAEQEDHDGVVGTCWTLNQTLEASEAKRTPLRASGIMPGMPLAYRTKLMKQYAASLAESLNKEK